MNKKREATRLSRPANHALITGHAQGRQALRNEYVDAFGRLTLEPPQCSEFTSSNRVNTGSPAFRNENIVACIPAIDTPENIRASEIATRELNAGFLNLILEGEYTDAFLANAGKDAPKYDSWELEIIASPIDFVGLNIYAPQSYVVAAERAPGFNVLHFPESFPHMSSEWLRIGPETAYWVPRLAAKVWSLDTIYISENGTSAVDQLTSDGNVHDLDRIMYLRNYLSQLQRATSEGVPVRGYFLWSLMDNFEWIFGLAERFGLYHVDFTTQVRTSKLSASFYRNVIARNAVGA